MTDTIAITGIVATTPHPIATGDDLKITSFRLASAQRRFDKGRNRWVDGETNWYTVTAFRQLAANVSGSVVKGDRVVVTGRLRIRDWANGAKSGTNVDVEADSVGHDLAWGTTSFTRVNASSHATDTDSFPSDGGLAGVDGSTGELPDEESGIESGIESESGAPDVASEARQPLFGTADATTPF